LFVVEAPFIDVYLPDIPFIAMHSDARQQAIELPNKQQVRGRFVTTTNEFFAY